MEYVYVGYLISIAMLGILLGVASFLVVQQTRDHRRKKDNENLLVSDQRGRQLYIHESHILMAGFDQATECINCGGNSITASNLKKLIIPCSMELSVYDGNNKFKHSTGETNV